MADPSKCGTEAGLDENLRPPPWDERLEPGMRGCGVLRVVDREDLRPMLTPLPPTPPLGSGFVVRELEAIVFAWNGARVHGAPPWQPFERLYVRVAFDEKERRVYMDKRLPRAVAWELADAADERGSQWRAHPYTGATLQ